MITCKKKWITYWVLLGLITILIATQLLQISVTNWAIVKLNKKEELPTWIIDKPWIARYPRISWILGEREISGIHVQESKAIAYWVKSPRWNAKMLVSKSRRAAQRNQYDGAVQLAILALRLNPGSADAAIIAGESLNKQHKWKNALPYWQIAITNKPDDPQIETKYGLALYNLGDLAARRHLEKAVLLQPTNWNTNYNYLIFLRDYGSVEEYQMQLSMMRTLFPEAVVLLRLQGLFALQNGRYDVAEAYLLEVFRQRPQWVKVVTELEEIYTHTNRLDRATLLYEEAIRQSPDNEEYYIGLFRTLQKIGDVARIEQYVCQLKNNHTDLYEKLSAASYFQNITCDQDE